MKTKEDNLCMYIETLINSIYCGRAVNPENIDPYMELIDGLKKIGFKFDFDNPTTFNEIKL